MSQLKCFGMAFVMAAMLAGAAAAQSGQSQSQQAQKPAQAAQPDQDDMQAAVEAAKPGQIHEQLMKRAGEYTTAIKFFTKPGTLPIESAGTAALKPILGGRFLEEQNAGESLGSPFEGLRLYGYNNGSKQYEAVWIYDGSTAILVLDGTSDDNGKTVRYSGAFIDPDGKTQTLRITVEQIDDAHFVVRLFGSGPLDSAPMVETTYTRKIKKQR